MFLDRGGVKKGAHEEKEAMRSKGLGVLVSYRQFSTYLFITSPFRSITPMQFNWLGNLCDEVVPGIGLPT